MSYDKGKYGVIRSKWFGLTKKHGGDVAAGYTFGTTDATRIDHLDRWYPRGPIRMLKAGHYVLATVGGGGTAFDQVPARVLVNGSVETTADWNISDAAAPYAKGSAVSFTNDIVDAGSYIGFSTGTPESTNGTAANTATVTGTVAFFLDYVDEFDPAESKHYVTPKTS